MYIKRTIVAGAAMMAASAGLATDAYLNDFTNLRLYWTNASKWVDSSGSVLTAAPTTSVDNAYIVDRPGGVRRRQLFFGEVNNGTTLMPDYAVGSVSGSYLNTITFQASYVPSIASHKDAYTLSIGNPDNFEGFWENVGAGANFRLEGDGDGMPQLSHLNTKRCPQVTVPTEGRSAAIGDLYGGGAVEKLGRGELVVRSVQTGRPRIYVREGGVTLSGEMPSGPTVLASALAKAVMHLDASEMSSLVVSGTGQVTRWNDVRGGERPYAYVPSDGELANGSVSLVHHANAPEIRPAASPTGLSVVDFGAQKLDEVDEFGQAGRFMFLSTAITGVREVFYAIARPNGLNDVPVLGGIDDNGDNRPFYPSYGALLYERYASPSAYMGDIRVDGAHVANNDYSYPVEVRSRMHAVGIGTTNGVLAAALACERKISEKVGGMLIGEVIVFTEPLTIAERTAIDGYLVRKWEDTARARDVSALFMADGTSVHVPAGRVATVSQLVAGTNSVEKTGGGVLRIGRLYATGGGFSVKDGSVEFARADTIPSCTPAGEPWLWLDATADGSMVMDGAKVMRWNDRRMGEVSSATNYAAVTEDATSFPDLVADGCGAKPVVDFGKSTSGAWMDLSRTGSDYACAVFMVVRRNTLGKENLFGSSNQEGRRNSSNSAFLLTSDAYKNPKLLAAQWTIDGVPADPRLPCPALMQTDDFFVVGYSGAEAARFDKLFRDQNGTGAEQRGGFQLAEYLLYDRVLSEEESRRTQAYLMNRWLGKAHPENCGSAEVAEMANSADSPIVFSADYDITAGYVSGGNGTVIKTGSGKVKADLAADGLSGIDVEGGMLELSLRLPFENEALFHFDAADAGSFEVECIADGDAVKTNVIAWADTRRNGIVATSTRIWASNAPGVSWRYAAMNVADPVLGLVETAPGHLMPAVNFGNVRNSSNGTDAGLENNASSLTLPQAYQAGDVFTVYADTGGNGKCGFIVGNRDQAWMREGKYLLSLSNSSADARGGYFSVDGEDATYRTALTHGQFYVVGYGANAEPIAIDAICQDRVANAGGGTVCEQIAFSSNLCAEARQTVIGYLKAKWLHRGLSPYSAADVAFSFAFDGSGRIGMLKIDEQVDFSRGAEFTFLAKSADALPHAGRWPFLECADATGYDASRISVVNAIGRRKALKVVKEGNVFYLDMRPTGLVVGFR